MAATKYERAKLVLREARKDGTASFAVWYNTYKGSRTLKVMYFMPLERRSKRGRMRVAANRAVDYKLARLAASTGVGNSPLHGYSGEIYRFAL
jgi:hypothetical protein